LVTVHTWFHLDENYFISLLIIPVPHHLKWWHDPLFGMHEILMKPPLRMALAYLSQVFTAHTQLHIIPCFAANQIIETVKHDHITRLVRKKNILSMSYSEIYKVIICIVKSYHCFNVPWKFCSIHLWSYGYQCSHYTCITLFQLEKEASFFFLDKLVFHFQILGNSELKMEVEVPID